MHFRILGRRLWALAMAGAFASQMALADTKPQTDGKPVALAEALNLTLERNPTLATFPYRLRAADADRLQAALRPQPTLTLEAENLAGKAPADGVNGAELTLALSQVIELGGKRRERMAVASLARDDSRLAYEQARLDILGEAVSRYILLATLQEQVELAQRSLALTRQSESAARQRVRAGAAPQADLTRLTLASQQADIALQRAQVERDAASQQLAALWGEADVVDLVPVTALRPLPELPTLQAINAQLDQAPDLMRLANEARLQEAQMRLAKANGRRDVEITLGARHDRLTDDNTLVAGLSIPLNLRNPNRGNIARAQAQLAESEAQLNARRIELISALQALYRNLSLVREELALVEDSALPLARQLYRDIEKGYRVGRYSLLDLTSAQQEQIALEQQAIELAARFHQHRNEIERLTGLSLSLSGEQEIAQ
jgi:cobalt-zinc-cadmium efflux system outer membrane protein